MKIKIKFFASLRTQIGQSLIEELKHNAPFWKQETLTDKMRWVQSN
jgi:molybdopterin synthase catalytic subunit